MNGQLFSVGDIVTTKNDTVRLCVESYSETMGFLGDPGKYVRCLWWNGNELKRDWFIEDTLKPTQ